MQSLLSICSAARHRRGPGSSSDTAIITDGYTLHRYYAPHVAQLTAWRLESELPDLFYLGTFLYMNSTAAISPLLNPLRCPIGWPPGLSGMIVGWPFLLNAVAG
jgi:hypothetical protein